MSSILGLVSGKTFTDNSFLSLNDRRRVFHQYPNGAASLTGLLSLMETEATDNAEFGWFEKRYVQTQTILSAGGGDAPFSPTGSNTASASPLSLAAGTVYRINVADTSQFRVTQVIHIQRLPLTNSTFIDVRGTVTEIVNSTHLEFRCLEAAALVLNTTNTITSGTKGPVNAVVVPIGTSVEEGGSSTGNGRLTIPCNPTNYTQIFRTPFSFTNTALQQPTNFDKTGIYREKAKDNCVDHMTEIEKAILFGTKSLATATAADGEDVPIRTTGGVEYFLRQWEVAASIYRGSSSSALTADTDDEKRIIDNVTGTMTKAVFNSYIERAFRVTNNKSYEKLVLCGSGVLTTINDLIEARIVVNKNMPAESTFGMNVTSIETPHGVLHFKSHPLFTEVSNWRYMMMILDVQNMRFRPLNNRDTMLRRGIQANDADRRKDEWLTEAGLEVRKPEANMIIKNFQAVTLT